jgi:hypothetical protein
VTVLVAAKKSVLKRYNLEKTRIQITRLKGSYVERLHMDTCTYVSPQQHGLAMK